MLRETSSVQTLGPDGTGESLAHAVASATSRRLAAAAEQDMRARYDLGRTLRSIREGSCRADSFLDAVAQALAVHPSLLRRYIRVATLIAPSQFEAFASLRDPRGMPLTWSHVEHLADVRSKTQRTLIAEEAVAQSLSVRALRLQIRRVRAANAANPLPALVEA